MQLAKYSRVLHVKPSNKVYLIMVSFVVDLVATPVTNEQNTILRVKDC